MSSSVFAVLSLLDQVAINSGERQTITPRTLENGQNKQEVLES